MDKRKYSYQLAVQGMHCAACELTIEKCFKKLPIVASVDARLQSQKVFFNLKGKTDLEELRTKANEMLADSGYVILPEGAKETHKADWNELGKAAAIAMVIIGIFLLLEKLGIVNLLNNSAEVNLPFIFFTGIIASLSSCMAVVGGLVLSFSSNLAQHSHLEKVKPLALFHLSRIIGFFILGGIVGILGSAFALSPTVTIILDFLLFLVMLIMGANLLNIFPWMAKLQPHMPKIFARKALDMEGKTTNLTALFLGIITFFLPCGFTQAAQFTALSTGSFIQGALTMLVFALGTFPMLALVSFASVKLSGTLQSGLFFKVAGILIIFFAFINLRGAFIAAGIGF